METSDHLPVEYRENSGGLFSLAFKTGLLVFITLGIYRFWQKTRIRKFMWSSARAGGDAFEYTGTGLEKFLGFLIAIVVLAVYLGIVQMILFYFGLSVLAVPTGDYPTPAEIARFMAAFYISIVAVLPLLFYAAYRARRYKMARTRWRGIRFGMEKGAWGYAARAIGYGLLSVVTLGILTPLATFKLEKYMADRSYYGDARFEQGGKWTDLFACLKHVLVGVLLVITGIAAGFAGSNVLSMLMVLVGYIWGTIGLIYYRVHSFAYLTRHKILGQEVLFTSDPSAGKVIKISLLGSLAVGLAAAILLGVLALVTNLVAMQLLFASPGMMIGFGLLVIAAYVLILATLEALSLMIIVQPILAHYVSTISVQNAPALNRIHQRATETGIDAEGFADALDIGGAI
ncbi:DUF898 family protein [Tropicibacter naphthalenivorans]|uniref:Putative membrane protein n=1 Tax=Tropicibacter naphthalenivorans TaxID=441103 RepID=A0A0P1GBY9_9RHOB|nr:DUF898 family protein [Tropicibacter naphthalenivorans]CUH78956.1 putative membrane protein [Tropicibacter naphthalenivorans]SMD04141.1 Uncharacterized membrane protein YjgN, DUF898 family [Tropicibacter naphthalenivorans]